MNCVSHFNNSDVIVARKCDRAGRKLFFQQKIMEAVWVVQDSAQSKHARSAE